MTEITESLVHQTRAYLMQGLANARSARAERLIASKILPESIRMAARDSMGVYRGRAGDSAGVFSILQTESFDPLLHLPLQEFTFNRDADFRTDVSLGTDATSFTLQSFGRTGGLRPGGKKWAASVDTTASGGSVDSGKTTTPVWAWVDQLQYSIFELARSQMTGQPIDMMQVERLNRDWQQDADIQFYLGDSDMGVKGLLNWTTGSRDGTQSGVTALSAGTKASPASGNAWFKTSGALNASPEEILADVRALCYDAYSRSGYTVYPDRILVPPFILQHLLAPISVVSGGSTATGASSIYEYLQRNSPSIAFNGRALDILPVKYLTGTTFDSDFSGLNATGSTTNRIVAYTKRPDLVRFPWLPITSPVPPQWIGVNQIIHYAGKLGAVEMVRPETVAYMDGV